MTNPSSFLLRPIVHPRPDDSPTLRTYADRPLPQNGYDTSLVYAMLRLPAPIYSAQCRCCSVSKTYAPCLWILTGRLGNHFTIASRFLSLGYCCKAKLVRRRRTVRWHFDRKQFKLTFVDAFCRASFADVASSPTIQDQ